MKNILGIILGVTALAWNFPVHAQTSISGGTITNPAFSTGSTAIGTGAVVANGATSATQIGAGTNGVSNSIQLSGKVNVDGNTVLGNTGNSTTTLIQGASTTINTVSTVINSTTTQVNTLKANNNVTAAGYVTGTLGVTSGGDITAGKTLRAGAGGANAAAILDGYAEVKQNLYVGGTSITYGSAIVKQNLAVDGSATAASFATTGNKFTVNGANGNTIIQGVTQTLGGLYVGPRAEGSPALQVNGAGNLSGGLNVGGATTIGGAITANGGILMKGNKITGLRAGVDGDDAANMNNLATTLTSAKAYADGKVATLTATVSDNAAAAATATARVQTNLDATNATVAANAITAKTYTDDRITSEENARIAGDVATLNAANTYTDSRITNQSGADRAYTDRAVAGERDRAMAAEAALSKETKQVGAMAMAAAGVAGATPVGDKKTAVTAAVGAYSGETAIAVGVTRLIKENVKAFGAFSKISGGKTGVTVGASFSF